MFFLQQSLAQKVLPACENLFPSCWKCQDNPCNNKVNIWFLVHAYALKNLQFTFIENHCKEYLLTYRNTAKPWLRYRYMYKSAKLLFCLTKNSRFHLGQDCWNWCYRYSDISKCINYGNVKYCPVKMMSNYQYQYQIMN